MATTYLQLVNDVNARVNEVQLTSSNFASADGVHQVAKQAVNDSLRYISQEKFQWPFFHVTYDETLVAGTLRYAYQSNAKVVDYDTFRIQRNATFGNATTYLRPISYDDYIKYGSDHQYNTSTGIRSIPKYVAKAPNQEYVVWPSPDEAYTLTYEYWKYPTDLSAHGDTMEYPDGFRQVVVDGAMYYIYLFRGDYENADRIQVVFMEKLKNLRSIFINDYRALTDTRIIRDLPYSNAAIRTS